MIFDGYLAPAPDGTRAPLHHYTQEVPPPTDAEGDEPTSRCPYTLTVLQSGREDDAEGTVTVAVVICICDTEQSRQGHRDILHIIQKIKARFQKTPLLAGQFVCKSKIEWVLEEEQPWPLYFGGLRLVFDVPVIQREDGLA